MPQKPNSRRKPQQGQDEAEAAEAEPPIDHSDVLANPRHEAFAQAVASGASSVEGYKNAFGCTQDSAESNSSRLRENEVVAARIGELLRRQAEKCEMKREELVSILVKTLRAKPSDASLDNPLCDLKMSKAGPYPAFTDKSKAAERLCNMLGWDAPSKVEINDTTPREPLEILRERVRKARQLHARA